MDIYPVAPMRATRVAGAHEMYESAIGRWLFVRIMSPSEPWHSFFPRARTPACGHSEVDGYLDSRSMGVFSGTGVRRTAYLCMAFWDLASYAAGLRWTSTAIYL